MPATLSTGLAASALALAALAATGLYATVVPGSQLFGPVLVAPAMPDQVALTFDDGPNPSATPHLLEVLARHNVSATFFLIGRWALREPSLTRQIAAAGHRIGNHTMSHPWLPRCSIGKIHDQLAGCNHILEDILGSPVQLFRPPHGARTPAVIRTAHALGLTTVQWNLIVGDWQPLPASTLLGRLESGLSRNRRRNRGTCLVLHDGGQHDPSAPRSPTVQAVDRLLSRLPPDTQFVLPPFRA